MRLKAVDKLKSDTNFISKIVQEDDDSNFRRGVVDSYVEDKELLWAIAQNDQNESVRIGAFGKLKSEELLKSILEKDKSKYVREECMKIFTSKYQIIPAYEILRNKEGFSKYFNAVSIEEYFVDRHYDIRNLLESDVDQYRSDPNFVGVGDDGIDRSYVGSGGGENQFYYVTMKEKVRKERLNWDSE